MRSRREFLQLAAVSASYFTAMPNFARAAAQQRLTQDDLLKFCLLYTSPSPRDLSTSRMPSSA